MMQDSTSVEMVNTSRVDIIIKNKKDIKGPLTINLHLVNDQTPLEVTVDGKTSSLSPDKSYKFKSYGRTIFVTAIITFALAIVIGAIFAISHFIINPSETKDGFHIVSRKQWLARPPVEPPDNLEIPVHRVIIAHTASSNCSSQASCSSQVQNIQNFQMDGRGFKDIVYNFLVGGDGNIYEGRGWNARGAHTKGFDIGSICIAFIGTFRTIKPVDKQLNACKRIIDEGVRLNKLVKDFKLYGARQFIGTESPGSALYDVIKHWPNWSNIY